MQKWEYLVVIKIYSQAITNKEPYKTRLESLEYEDSKYLGFLDLLGEDGWELVTHATDYSMLHSELIFKRPKS